MEKWQGEANLPSHSVTRDKVWTGMLCRQEMSRSELCSSLCTVPTWLAPMWVLAVLTPCITVSGAQPSWLLPSFPSSSLPSFLTFKYFKISLSCCHIICCWLWTFCITFHQTSQCSHILCWFGLLCLLSVQKQKLYLLPRDHGDFRAFPVPAPNCKKMEVPSYVPNNPVSWPDSACSALQDWRNAHDLQQCISEWPSGLQKSSCLGREGIKATQCSWHEYLQFLVSFNINA